jgi:type II secretory pathway pseudopilin PulG
MKREPGFTCRRQAGFTLAEMLVAAGVTAILLLGVLAVFDFNNRVARVQTHVADMQQALRVAQYDMVRLVRMTGRGGLPAARATGAAPLQLPNGVAVAFTDDVPADTMMIPGNNGTRVLEGTDVLTIRGIFSTPIYQANSTDPATLLLSPNPNAPDEGWLVLQNRSPTGVPQDLQPFVDVREAATPEALLLVSPLDDALFAVAEIDPGGTVVVTGAGGEPTQVTIHFLVTGGANAAAFAALSRNGAFPPSLRVAYAGILEEYRFYVREDHVVPTDRNSDLAPRLSRARFLPGTASVYQGIAANAAVDIADNIMDLQVALGVDRNNDRTIVDDGTADDEWLGNNAGDLADLTRWQANPPANLYYIRVSTLAQTDRRDPEYQGPLLTRLENRTYGASFNTRTARMFRRRAVQTVIDLRNLA